MPRPTLSIEFSNTARQQLSQYQNVTPELETMIRETLSLDPRPAYRREKKDLKEYRVLFDRFNIHWSVVQETVVVQHIDLNS